MSPNRARNGANRCPWLAAHARVALFVCALAAGAAFGHAHLARSEPAAGATVAEGVDDVTLVFSEPVEVRFSTFRLFELGERGRSEGGGEAPAAEAPAEEEVAALFEAGEQAAGLLPTRIEAADGGAEEPALEVVLRPEEALAPGAHLVAWRVLAVDGHGSSGNFVFVVAADEP